MSDNDKVWIGEVGRLLPFKKAKIKPADLPKGINVNLLLVVR
jgi:hypothetical protein